MKTRQVVAVGLAAVMAGISILAQEGPPQVTLTGWAKKEAKKPYSNYITRARNSQSGEIAATATNTDPDANFTLTGMPPANYIVELLKVDKRGNMTLECTEGPFDMTQVFIKNNIEISCGKIPAAWWLLGVASAAGVTAGVAVNNASASQ